MPTKKLRKSSKRITRKNKRKNHKTTKRKTIRHHKKMHGGLFSYGTKIPEGATRIVTIDGVPTSVSDDVYKDYQNGTYDREL